MKELLLIRHGETDLAGTFCGQSDPPVNAAGQRQIEALVDALRGEELDAIYCSDLQRAVVTAEAIANGRLVACSMRARLSELDFGRWEGLTWSQVEALDPTYAAKWTMNFPRLPAPGGESFECFEARVTEEMRHILGQPDQTRIAIISHAGVMRTILQTLCGVNDEESWALTKPYCCVYRFIWKSDNVAAVNR